MSKKRTTINIDKEILKSIQCYCIMEESKVSELIEELLIDFLKRVEVNGESLREGNDDELESSIEEGVPTIREIHQKNTMEIDRESRMEQMKLEAQDRAMSAEGKRELRDLLDD